LRSPRRRMSVIAAPSEVRRSRANFNLACHFYFASWLIASRHRC
jgi:hypothetical protein